MLQSRFNHDTRLWAFSLIAQFLADNDLQLTLETFRTEAPTVFEDIEKTILPSYPDADQDEDENGGESEGRRGSKGERGTPLMRILEEYEGFMLSSRMEKMVVERKLDDRYITPGDDSFANKQLKELSNIHTGNILCVRCCTLPTSLWPAHFNNDNNNSSDAVEDTFQAVITSSSDKSIRISDATTGSLITILPNFGAAFSGSIGGRAAAVAAILAIDIHPTLPHILLVSGMDGAHHIVDLRTLEPAQSFRDHKKYVVRAQFSPFDDGEWFATGSHDRTVHIYRRTTTTTTEDAMNTEDDDTSLPDTPRYEKVHTLTFRGPVESMCFLPPLDPNTSDPTSTLVVGTRDDNYLHYIDLTTSGPAPFPHTRINMNTNNDDWVSFTPMHLSPSPSGHHLACFTDSQSGRIIIFRSRSQEQVRNLYGPVIDAYSQP
ncbi:hypothetical protein HK102_008536, partial [Quaeritorhiza haematococci]